VSRTGRGEPLPGGGGAAPAGGARTPACEHQLPVGGGPLPAGGARTPADAYQVTVGDDPVLVSLDAAGREVRRRCADVLYGAGDPALAEELLARYPGCLLVSVRDGAGRCVTLSRTGRRICVAPVTGEREHAHLAAALHRWVVALSAPQAPAAGLRGAGRPRG
jgi:hypothetical protein